MAYRGPSTPGATGVCPGCGGGLRAETVGRNAVEVCAGCAGVWLAEPELQELKIDPGRQRALLDWQRGRLRAEPAAPPGPCPRCAEVLTRRRFGAAGVVVEVCARDGVWLAPGELGALVELMASRAARGGPDPELRLRTLRPEDVAGYLREPRGGWLDRLFEALGRKR
jgi:Zn-finger nucleic acid-binding protein